MKKETRNSFSEQNPLVEGERMSAQNIRTYIHIGLINVFVCMCGWKSVCPNTYQSVYVQYVPHTALDGGAYTF